MAPTAVSAAPCQWVIPLALSLPLLAVLDQLVVAVVAVLGVSAVNVLLVGGPRLQRQQQSFAPTLQCSAKSVLGMATLGPQGHPLAGQHCQ